MPGCSGCCVHGSMVEGTLLCWPSPPPLSYVTGCLLPSPLQAPDHKHFPGSSECVGVGVGVLSQVQRVLAWLCCHLPCSFEHVPHKEPLSQLHETQLRSYPQCKLTGVLSGS